MSQEQIRDSIFRRLQQQNCFWSYQDVRQQDISDDMLIEKALVYLDIPDIDRLIACYGKRHVKQVFRERLVPQGDYLYTLNRFLAWYYFGVKQPDKYLHQQTTRHLNRMKV